MFITKTNISINVVISRENLKYLSHKQLPKKGRGHKIFHSYSFNFQLLMTLLDYNISLWEEAVKDNFNFSKIPECLHI
jgi:hypothetical protein